MRELHKGLLGGPLQDNLLRYARSSPEWVRGRQEGGYLILPIPSGEDPPRWMGDLTRRSLKLLLESPLCGQGSLDPDHEFLAWDRYLIHYPEGSCIPEHTDPVPEGQRHIRLNAQFGPAVEGGVFHLCGNPVLLRPGDAVVFRPDRDVHEVTRVTRGDRWLWSVGAVDLRR